MSQHITLQPAFILHTRAYKNTSLLIDFFTEEHGRMTAVARGARRSSFKQRGILQPFCPLLISWIGRSDLVTLTEVEAEQYQTYLSGKALLTGFYLNELLIRVLKPQDAHQDLFQLYRNILQSFGEAGADAAQLRLFEKRLLDAIGYGLPLTHTGDTGVLIQPECTYYFEPELGFIESKIDHQSKSSFSGASLQAFAQENFTFPEYQQAAKRLMRMALRPHIGDKPIQSRQLFVK